MRFALLAASLAFAAAAGCYTGSAVDTNSPYRNVIEPTESADAEEEPGEEEPATASGARGLPCDVAVLVKTSCGACHGATPKNGAETTIATWADLTAESAFDPSKTVAEVALARMRSKASPMPPSGNLGKDEIAILADWIAGGMKEGTCEEPKPKADAGAPPPRDGGRDATAATRPSVCTSEVTADPEVFGPTMRPGRACVSCHASQGGPAFAAAGTVYPSLTEPDDCHGVGGATDGTKVLLIDANGAMRVLAVNGAGNFSLPATVEIAKPFKAVVVRGNQIREMKGLQSEGDCNSCHTERGKNGAPGRIMAP